MMQADHKLEFEYSQITPQIFIGTNQCCLMHFRFELLEKGIAADISLEDDKLDMPLGASYYLWLPVKDGDAPTDGQFLSGAKFMDELVRRGEKVYVHCEHGHGRAPTLVAAYFVYTEHLTPDAAFALIQRARPAAHPNPLQLSRVAEFSQRHAGGTA